MADRILIVEDESAFAQVVESYLERMGYRVSGIVDSGEEALKLAATSRPDLALMDIEIRGAMDGFEVAERFHQEHDIPIIFLTGRSDEETLERVRRSASFGYLLKPFRPEELKAAVELALIRHGHETQQKQIELSLSAAVESAGDAMLMADKAGTVSYLNPAAERLTGWPVRKAIGQKLKAIFQMDDGADALEPILRSASQGAFVHEAVLRTAAGRQVPIEVSVASVRHEVHGLLGTVLVFRDITERKRFEAELKKSQADLRRLAGHVESAREEERTRIAREVHDELGQVLTGFKFDLAWLEKKLSAKPETPRVQLLEKVRGMDELLKDMVQSVRRISAELRPGLLDDLGLTAAVEWQAKEFQTRTGIKTQVSAAFEDPGPSPPVATALFRILQESLTNVARHAQAGSVRVTLRVESGCFLLEVSDDGCGITEKELNKAGAFGLLGMRERMIPLRGSCEIHGTPGQGTTVRVQVPLEAVPTTEGKHD